MELLHKELTGRIPGVAVEVHRERGCGFLEAPYQEAFEHELKLNQISFISQKPHRAACKDIILRHPDVPDLVVEGKAVVDLKAIRKVGAIEEAQMINYLKITMAPVGLIINFAGGSLERKRLVSSGASPVELNNPRNPRFQTRQQQSL